MDDWPKPGTPLRPDPVRGGGAACALPPTPPPCSVPWAWTSLEPLAATLAGCGRRGRPRRGPGLRAWQWPEPGPLVAAVVAACQRLAASDRPFADACAAAVRVAADHPGDVGVLALLLMRHEVLQPGQAVFMPAGGLHAYLHGTGIELLANSDNVVRSGLTGKHIDVPELLRLLDPAVAVPVLSPRPLADGLATFDTPAEEFRLYLLDVAASLALPGTGPRILLCLDGACTLRAAVRPGSST